MTIQTVLAELRGERDRISSAIAALESLDGSTGRNAVSGKRTVSLAARRRMARAQRARWAKAKSAPKLTLVRTMSASARRKIAAAQRARWARDKRAAA